MMEKKLFLLDGMALVYRSHFALISRPIFTSTGVNTSALYGFTQTLLEIIREQKPTHIAVAFDTEAPTQRHVDFPDYKIQRESMPEDIGLALPHIRRMVEAFNIPLLTCDGYEADDIIGTVVKGAEQEGFVSYMVTPDKDFAQLVSERTFLYKPSRMGDRVEILGLAEVLKRWGITDPKQVIDILGLWGDVSDNIPGVPGIGEKTAIKLISEYGSIENLLAHTDQLKGKLKENLETFREQALLSKRLVTICCDAPCQVDFECLRLRDMDTDKVKGLCVEFEFNSIGRRLFGQDFRAGRGFEMRQEANAPSDLVHEVANDAEMDGSVQAPPVHADLKRLEDVPHKYEVVREEAGRERLRREMRARRSFSFSVETTSRDPKQAKILGIGFSLAPHEAYFVPLGNSSEAAALLREFEEIWADPHVEKTGHDVKFAVSLLKWHGVEVRGTLFDVMLAHCLAEPDMRHGLGYMAESYLGYCLARGTQPGAKGEQMEFGSLDPEQVARWAMEEADIAFQLRQPMEQLLRERSQERVFYEIEVPLVFVLVDMEYAGVRVDSRALEEFSVQLSNQMAQYERTIYEIAGRSFNLNSPRQLGEVLFDELKLAEKPKKTRTGQYATNEQTLLALAAQHQIVQRLLDYRMCSKLKSTYADSLPLTIWPKTGRVHTTYNQAVTSTGRLQSENPNLQNIPIRTEAGREIRKAFIPRDPDYLLLSADYSQIELRIIAALSRETAMIQAFQGGTDVHTATAAHVFGVPAEMVTAEMRRKAKMVNYGIAYGISAFGLAQRLGIARKEAGEIIDRYFHQFAGIREYMAGTVAFAREHGYVETVTGRRRYIRDIRSSNGTVRAAAERNAINAPIQGTAADMIKIAMTQIHGELVKKGLRTRMLLQVHDELVFEVHKEEEELVRELVRTKMISAIPLQVPIVVDIGIGGTWLEAH